MKEIFGLFLTISCISHFGTIEGFAQKSSEPQEVIRIEFTAPTELLPPDKRLVKFEVPISRSFRERQGLGGGIASGGAAGCSHCSAEHIERINENLQARLQKQNYFYFAEAWRVNKKSVKLKLEMSVQGGDCKTRKVLTIDGNRRLNIQLGCDLNILAYPAFNIRRQD